MRRISVLVMGVVAIAGFATQAFAATKTVSVDDDFFSPKTLAVKKNDTVKFKFVGESLHNVTANGKEPFSTITDRDSGTVSRKARKKGSFRLVCTIHDGMKMTLKVK